jgi:hypothetical protein
MGSPPPRRRLVENVTVFEVDPGGRDRQAVRSSAATGLHAPDRGCFDLCDLPRGQALLFPGSDGIRCENAACRAGGDKDRPVPYKRSLTVRESVRGDRRAHHKCRVGDAFSHFVAQKIERRFRSTTARRGQNEPQCSKASRVRGLPHARHDARWSNGGKPPIVFRVKVCWQQPSDAPIGPARLSGAMGCTVKMMCPTTCGTDKCHYRAGGATTRAGSARLIRIGLSRTRHEHAVAALRGSLARTATLPTKSTHQGRRWVFAHP